MNRSKHASRRMHLSVLSSTLLATCVGCYQPPAVEPPTTQAATEAVKSLRESKGGDLDELKETVQPTVVTNEGVAPLPSDEKESQPTSAPKPPATPTPAYVDDRTWIKPNELPWETAFAQYIGQERIGYSLIKVRRSAIEANSILRVTREDILIQKDSNSGTTHHFLTEAIESSNGGLKQFTRTAEHGDESEKTEGQVRDKFLTLDREGADGRNRQNVRYDEGTWGILGIQALLMRQPITAGEYLRTSIFLPELSSVAEVELLGESKQVTSLMGGRVAELTSIEVLIKSADKVSHSRVWVNERGEIEKSLSLVTPQILSYRIPAVTYYLLEAARKLDGLCNRSIPVVGKALPPQAPKKIVMRVETEEIDPFKMFVSSKRQFLRSLDPRTCELILQPSGSEDPASGPDDAPPTDADSQSSMYIPADHPAIKALANELIGSAVDAGSKADVIVKSIFLRSIKLPYDSSLPNSLQMARTMEGHQGSHATLIAALLRSQSIPARIVCGLQINPTTRNTATFRLWTEAWIDQQWIGFDAMTGERVGPGHIKMSNVTMSENAPYDELLTALDSLKKVKLLEIINSN